MVSSIRLTQMKRNKKERKKEKTFRFHSKLFVVLTIYSLGKKNAFIQNESGYKHSFDGFQYIWIVSSSLTYLIVLLLVRTKHNEHENSALQFMAPIQYYPIQSNSIRCQYSLRTRILLVFIFSQPKTFN